MNETSPGRYICHLLLASGVYRYKFIIDHKDWICDPEAPAIDTAEGFENGIAVINGLAGPIFFATNRQHYFLDSSGRFVLHAEFEGHAHIPSLLRFQRATTEVHRSALNTGESDKPEYIARLCDVPNTQNHVAHLLPIMQRGQRVLLQAESCLPQQIENTPLYAHFTFEGFDDLSFELPARHSALDSYPAWSEGAVFYSIFIDRWHRSNNSIPDPRQSSRDTPTAVDVFYGGDLDGIAHSLNYLCDLGVDAIILTPLHPAPTPHRYDASDLMAVDPLLGGQDALQRLINASHQHGLKIIADLSITHINEQHYAFQDLLQKQQHSDYCSWFHIHSFPVKIRDASTFSHYPTRPELPLLNLKPGPAREHVLLAAEKLVRAGFDGLRLDAMNDPPPDLWQDLRSRMRQINPHLLLLGEIITDRPARFAEHNGVDLATDFSHRHVMLDFFAYQRIDAEEFWARSTFYRFRAGPFDPRFHLIFLDNHDTPRFLSIAHSYDRLRLALTYLLFRPEPIYLTYGTEFNLHSGIPAMDLDDAWPERIPMPPLQTPQTRTHSVIRKMLALRRSLLVCCSQNLRLILARGSLLAIERCSNFTSLRLYLNNSEQELDIPSLPHNAKLLFSLQRSRHDQILAPLDAKIFISPANSS
jgi:glycosidase